MSNDDFSTDTLTGVSLVLIGGIIQSIGYICQKKAHHDCNKDDAEGSDKWYAKRFSWKIGIIIFLFGSMICAFALNFGAQCILIPLMSLPLVWITTLSACVFREPINFEDFLAILIIFFGAIMVIIFGPNLSNIAGTITITELRWFYSNIFFIVFAGAITLAIIIDLIIVKWTERKNYKSPNNRHISFGSHFLLFSYCIIAAYFDAMQILFLKSIMSLIGSSIDDEINFHLNINDYLTWIIIALYICTMLMMELFRNRGLAYFGALYVLPIFEVWSLILSSCFGAIYFQELQDVDPFQGTLFFVGIVILSIGLIILAWDIGKILENISDYIAVAFVDENKVKYHHTKGLVYGGFIPKLYQEYYFHKKTFFYNPDYGSYFSLSTDGNEEQEDEYDDSEDDLQIGDVHPLPIVGNGDNEDTMDQNNEGLN